jgi:hypothetical protein
MYISAVVVVVFINIIMSIAIIDFMMESVIPVLYESESIWVLLIIYLKKKALSSNTCSGELLLHTI